MSLLFKTLLGQECSRIKRRKASIRAFLDKQATNLYSQTNVHRIRTAVFISGCPKKGGKEK